MSTMTVQEALAKVLNEMKAMGAEQLREELLKHRNGEIAQALREAQHFFSTHTTYYAYPLHHVQVLLQDDLTATTLSQSLQCLDELFVANDASYSLAA